MLVCLRKIMLGVQSHSVSYEGGVLQFGNYFFVYVCKSVVLLQRSYCQHCNVSDAPLRNCAMSSVGEVCLLELV